GTLDRRVQHRHEYIEPFDRELLLPEKRPPQVALEPLDLRQPREQTALLVRGERRSVLARLDRLPQPDTLLVVGDVLDLVGARAGIGLLQLRKDIREGLPGE